MSIYKINTDKVELNEFKPFKFKYEGIGQLSPQAIIARFPEIILSVPELEIYDFDLKVVLREFNTNRGSIDILILTENADIILIETKLYKNPEFHRTVITQAIDYTKAIVKYDVEYFKSQFSKSKYSDKHVVEKLFTDDRFRGRLSQNIKTGNIKVIIVGDKIHPNIFEMVDALQSAPHLAFTLFLVELNPYQLEEGNILLYPKLLTNTVEIERSVIRVEVDLEKKSFEIDSTIPDKEGKGSKPTISPEQYLTNLSKNEFREIIKFFWKNWKEIGGDIRFGVVGFSAGIPYGGKRIAFQFVYDNRLDLVSDALKIYCNIPENIYQKYLEKLKVEVPKAYDYHVSNKVQMKFENLSENDLKALLDATIQIGKDLKRLEF